MIINNFQYLNYYKHYNLIIDFKLCKKPQASFFQLTQCLLFFA